MPHAARRYRDALAAALTMKRMKPAQKRCPLQQPEARINRPAQPVEKVCDDLR